jgi:serine protease Do
MSFLRSSLRICLFLSLVSFTTAPLAGNLPDFSSIVESQGAAVVNISTTQAAVSPSSHAPGTPGVEGAEEWMELLRRFLPQVPEIPEDDDGRSLGSGFIISPDGFILTNAHVIAGADEIVVRLVDKREFNARVVGVDPRSDVAVIRIHAQGLPIVRLGNPNRLKVGEWVLAIGSPFGFCRTRTLSPSSRPTWRSTRAIPGGRCSTCAVK